MTMKEQFSQGLIEIVKNKNRNCVFISKEQYSKILKEVSEAKLKTKGKTHLDYRRLQRYDVITMGRQKKLISPINSKSNEKNIRFFVANDDIFDVINNAHLNTGHGGRNKMIKHINEKYRNVTVECIMLYLSLCEICQKKLKNKKKAAIITPIITSEVNSRCQIDLIDLETQSDGEYKYILNYQDHFTKFIILRPLKTKSALEVASNLIDIFTIFGAPSILHSNNGTEFVNDVINELITQWDEIKMIQGKPCYCQGENSTEWTNQDVENMLATWTTINKTDRWSEGLKYVQMMKNRSYNEDIRQSPYEAVFGTTMKLGLKTSNFPEQVIIAVQSEEELENIINKDPLNVAQEAESDTNDYKLHENIYEKLSEYN